MSLFLSYSQLSQLTRQQLELILHLFEFQHSRLHLLRLVLSLHPVAHANHKHRGYDSDAPFEPDVLSPTIKGRMDFYADVAELKQFYEGTVERDQKGKAKEGSLC